MTKLGTLDVGHQGFGGMALAEVYGPTDQDSALHVLHHALDAGIRHIDTADVYGAGSNERLVARLLRERTDAPIVATKLGILSEPDADGFRARGDAAYVRDRALASLDRLGIKRIDLLYYHRVDPRVPIEDTVGALAELVSEGLVDQIGLSEVTASELERAYAVHPIAAVQSEWSVWSRDVETSVIPTAARLGVGFVAYSPLGRGFLAAPVTELAEGDLRRRFPRFGEGTLSENQHIGETVRRIAAADGVTPAQVALAWITERARALGVQVLPIPSTRRPERIDENLAAVAVSLSPASVAELNTLAAGVRGDRARFAEDISQGRERAETAAAFSENRTKIGEL